MSKTNLRSLLSCAVTGEKDSLKEICRLYGPKAYGFFYGVLGKQAEQEQALFIKCFQEAIKMAFYHKQSFLVALMFNLMACLESKEIKPGTLRFEEVSQDIKIKMMVSALSQLESSERARILLRDQVDLSYSEIAQVLALSKEEAKEEVETAKSLLKEAMMKTILESGNR